MGAPEGLLGRAEALRDHRAERVLDGVSLTVSQLDNRSFTVSLIPETLERTNLGDAIPGTTVNLEVDVLAKYVERLMRGRDD